MPRRGPQKAGLSGLFLCGVATFASTLVLSALMLATAAAEPIFLEITDAVVAFDQRTSEPVVSFRMTPASQRLFADFKSKNVGRKTEFRLDGRLLMSPVIREPILGGAGQISSKFTVEDARDIAERLSSGRAKIEIEAVD